MSPAKTGNNTDSTAIPGNISQDFFYQVLKGGWGIAEAEWHHLEMPQPLTNGESWGVPHAPAPLTSSHCGGRGS